MVPSVSSLFGRIGRAAPIVILLSTWSSARAADTVIVRGEPAVEAPPSDDVAPVASVDLSRPGQAGAGRSVSVAEAVRGELSLRVRSAGSLGQYSAALLRGAAASQVTILIDGVPLNRGGQAAVDLAQLGVDGLARIDVYRGLAPLSFGADAIGGAINLVTRHGGRPGGTIVLGGGSFGLRKASAVGSARLGGVRLAASLGYHGANGDFPYYYTGGQLYSGDPPREAIRKNDGFDQISLDLREIGRAHV